MAMSVKIKDTEHGIKLKNKIEKIIHLGDILISYGDFVENNAELVPSGYVEEIWIEELQEKIKKYEPEKNRKEFEKFFITNSYFR